MEGQGFMGDDLQTPSQLKQAPPEDTGVWRSILFQAALWILGYVAFSGIIWSFERIGHRLEVPGLGIVGLAIDVGLLTIVIALLGRRSTRVSGVLGPLLGLLVVVLFFSVADWWFQGLSGHFWDLLRHADDCRANVHHCRGRFRHDGDHHCGRN